MSLTLMKRKYDKWKPAEHNGTFRGNNLAFVAATEALSYWENDTFSKEVQEKASLLSNFINNIVSEYPELKAEARGRGLMQGVACQVDDISEKIRSEERRVGEECGGQR